MRAFLPLLVKCQAVAALMQTSFAFLPSNTWSANRALSSAGQSFKTRQNSHTLSMMATGKFSKVFVAGGGNGVGLEVVNLLSSKGYEVVALVRREDAAEELGKLQGVTAVLGDALDAKVVEKAIDGCDAAITTLGGKAAEEGKSADYEGNMNVIESSGILGVTRVILVTSIGCGNSKDALSEQTYQTLERALLAKNKAETLLTKYYTNSDWTIVRPGGLMSAPATGQAILTEANDVVGAINRADVAGLVVQCLESSQVTRKILAAVDPSIESPFNSPNIKTVEAIAV